MFKVSDKVICVNAQDNPNNLQLNYIYTIIYSDDSYCSLEEFGVSKNFFNHRFKLAKKYIDFKKQLKEILDENN